MHEYYEWKNVLFHKKSPHCLVPLDYVIKGDDYRCLYQGKKVENWDSKNQALFDNDTKGELCDHLCGQWDVHFIKEGLRNFLAEALGDQVQFLPINLVNSDDPKVHYENYCILVSLHRIDCLDRENTEIASIAEDGSIMLKYGADPVLKRSLVSDDLLLFMINQPKRYVLRGDLVKELKKRKFTGLVFKKLEVT